MARKKSTSSTSHRRHGNAKKKGTSPVLIVGIVIVALAVIGFVVYKLVSGGSNFQRASIDKYVELTSEQNILGNGASVYVDMSDGMNYAYSTPESRAVLQAVINKLAADKAIEFYGLADEQITPLEMSHTQLYNYMLSASSYDKQKAPIQATLEKIVAAKQPALIMTDFEEYNSGVIQQAAYAKKAFIDWLAMGFKITFYKWDFEESGKQKHMFLAVFDDNADRLTSLVENAVKLTDPNMPTYVLAGHDFLYPAMQLTDATRYISPKQGGNYHNSKGQDNVTAVIENGDGDSYICYSTPQAAATGNKSGYTDLRTLAGVRAEYYPVGVSWTQALQNAQYTQQEGMPQEDMFTHLFSNIIVDFGAQSGYDINGIEVRVFDMQPTINLIDSLTVAGENVSVKTINTLEPKEVNMFLVGSMQPAPKFAPGVMEIFVDFDSKFTGTFNGGVAPTNVMRANIVISSARPDVQKAMEFFGWGGNPSLANSVVEALTASSSNPVGAVIFSYYLKAMGE